MARILLNDGPRTSSAAGGPHCVEFDASRWRIPQGWAETIASDISFADWTGRRAANAWRKNGEDLHLIGNSMPKLIVFDSIMREMGGTLATGPAANRLSAEQMA
jgi:hypothetical protein